MVHAISPRTLGAALAGATLAALAGAQPIPEWPDTLQRSFAAHSAKRIRTGRVEYVYTQAQPSRPEGQFRHFYTWRCAGDTLFQAFHGDEEGVIWRDADGKPAPIKPYAEQWYLVDEAGIWNRSADSCSADMMRAEDARIRRVVDLREVGTNPADLLSPPGGLLEEAARAHIDHLDYSEADEDGLKVVTAAWDHGKLRWWIDPQRDWLVVRTATYNDERQVLDTRIKLDTYDGVWFPSSIETTITKDGVPETVASIRTLYAEFDRPEHPRRLTPADLGLECGSTVWDCRPPNERPGGKSNDGVWDGQKLIAPEDFFERLAKGELRRGPNVTREMSRLEILNDKWRAQGLDPAHLEQSADSRLQSGLSGEIETTIETRWAAYTREFITHYGLATTQRDKALEVLAAAQRDARSHIASRRADIERWQKDLDALASVTDDSAGSRRAQIEDRKRKLVEPLDVIFESKLRGGLDRIPTEDQRKAAGPFVDSQHLEARTHEGRSK